MTIIANMTASLTTERVSKSEKLSNNPFEDFIHSRRRSERTGSLALPNNSLLDLYDKQQQECNSVALLPSNVNIRRHSSHYCPITDSKNIISDTTYELQKQNHQKLVINSSKSTNATAITTTITTATTTIIPPPVPKRTFKGRIMSKEISFGGDSIMKTKLTSATNMNTTATINNSSVLSNSVNFQNRNINNIDKNYERNHHSRHYSNNQYLNQSSSPFNNFMTVKSSLNQKQNSTQYVMNMNNDNISDDDGMSLENSVFNEPININIKTNNIQSQSTMNNISDLCIMNNSRHSNRSSSDSNKSQTTADTGYISNDNEKIFQSDNKNSRSRFSSVDTQSSLDSCLTERTIDSPLSKDSFKIDSEHSLLQTECNTTTSNNIHQSQNNQITVTSTMSSSSSSSSSTYYPIMNRTIKNLPTVPLRKQISTSSTKISSINSSSNIDNCTVSCSKTRIIPPTPPIRSQQSIDYITTATAAAAATSATSATTTENNYYMKQDDQQQKQQKTKEILTNDNNSKMITTNLTQNNNALNKSINAVRNKLNKNRPPPIVTHTKFHQRQDSNLSSDSYSMTSSPGYNCKSMEAPLLQRQTKNINKNSNNSNKNNNNNNTSNNKNNIRHQNSNDSFGMTTSSHWSSGKMNYRQDSSISSDSFSQTSSPGYNTKLLEAPLLLQAIKISNVKQNYKVPDEVIKDLIEQQVPTSPITKSTSTPASLQTIVRFQNGSNMSLQHRIINRRKSSNPYVTQGRLKFRLFQILLNAIALLAIAGGLAAYFNAYPTVKFINKTIITPLKSNDDNRVEMGKNPAPGVCLPIIVKFCQNNQLPYNYTVFPNYMGHFGQPEAQVVLEAYDALVDVRCYELVSLFLCTLFVPKCGPTGTTVPPCKILCTETMRRCGFFFSVFGLELPDYLTCNLFTDTNDPDGCVGLAQVREARIRALNPVCSGFLCDQKRCIPSDWRCDGHVDCQDQTDESQCNFCGKGSIYCGEKRCMSQKHICDGVIDCPYAQDERNCIRLSERNGDLGKGTLEIYKSDVKLWAPACVSHWDSSTSPSAVCSMLGYSSVNSSRLTMRGSNMTMKSSVNESPAMWRMYQKKHSNLMKEFSSCSVNDHYPVVELTCTNFECGKIRSKKYRTSRRIVGGQISNPGDWPFLAAILGGPEEIFYCAGVLIADQWVLTASHCIGNHTLRNINDWTIQLGVTRRHSHSYYGQKVKVLNVIPHPQYNSDIAHDNDIALFQLATKVAFHEHLLPVCLPPPGIDEIKPGTMCTVIGWGKREDKNLNPNAATASYEPSVNEVQVPILNRDLCNEWLDTPNVTEGMICAGYEDGGRDACQGDSGGPLLCPFPNERDKWFVGGIVSWGIMCAHPKLPGVYANVPKYIPWITEEINRYSNFDNNNNNNNNFGY